MKQAVIVLLLASVAVNCFGQQNTPGSISRPDRLQKSKNQKKAAWILLGGGAALFAIGVIIPQGEEEEWTFYGPDHKNDGIKAVFCLTGTLSMLGSIPLFIASGKNKRRAASVSANLQMQQSKVIQRAGFAKISYPAVAVKLNF